MIQGLYAAASGIAAMEERHAIIANNIANASTIGFRRQEPVQKGFYALFATRPTPVRRFDNRTAPGGGASLTETFTDTRNGAITATGNPMTVALTGPGYLSVDTPQGKRFTRCGDFLIDGEGQLATAEGFKILSAGGAAIDIPVGTMTISGDGTILIDGSAVDQLEVTEFQDPHMLAREGNALFVANDNVMAGAQPAEKTTVLQKSLEMPNVNVPQEMVAMLLGLRAYGANQKVVNAIDETAQRLIDQVAMPV